MIYFDTSYLAKCYLTDRGYVEVRHLASQKQFVVCCEFGRLELISAIHRKLREKEITSKQYNIIQNQIELDEKNGIWIWFSLTSEFLKKTASKLRLLPASTYIRSSDALHLMCAAENNFKEIYSSDKHLLAAAPLFGLRGIDVISS